MKKIVFNRFGPPEKVAECVLVDDLESPKDWEVTVDIMFAPVNPSDISVLRGQYGKLPANFPATTGLEAAGNVVAVGKMVENVKPGDRVLVLANDNWAQQRNLSASQVIPLPEWMDLEQASMVKVNAVSALMMLKHIDDLEEGEWIIQTAPLSAVGQMMIPFAKDRGLKTVNVVRRETAVEEVKALGGDAVVMESDTMAEDVRTATADARIRIAFDAVAGDGVAQLADCLDVGGTVLNYGMLSGAPCMLRADHTIFRNIRLEGFWLLKLLASMKKSAFAKVFQETFEIMERTNAKSEVSSSFPLEDISEAIVAAEAEGRRGKVLLIPNGAVS